MLQKHSKCSRTIVVFHTEWHLLLFLFEHRFVINQSGHVVTAVTGEIALIWTTPLGQTWSLTLMPFSATETLHPSSSPPSVILKSRGKRLPRHLSKLALLSFETKGSGSSRLFELWPAVPLHIISDSPRMWDSLHLNCLSKTICALLKAYKHIIYGGQGGMKTCDEDEGRTGQVACCIFNIAAIDFKLAPWERQNIRCTAWVLSTSVCVYSTCVWRCCHDTWIHEMHTIHFWFLHVMKTHIGSWQQFLVCCWCVWHEKKVTDIKTKFSHPLKLPHHAI